MRKFTFKMNQKQFFFALIVLVIFSIFIYSWIGDLYYRYSWTTSDKNSPFYGMKHRETYGLPLSSFDIEPFQTRTENWKVLFPETIFAINQYKLNKYIKEGNLYTHSFSIKILTKDLFLGEEFEASITSLDSKGRAKFFGGDYYRARLIRDDGNYPDGIPCRVVDNYDGTYTVKAPLVLEGPLILDVKLVISVEGVAEIIRQSDNLSSWGHQYVALFETGEIMPCNVNLSKFDELKGLHVCDYSNPRNKEPWYCVKPLSQTCSKILFMAYTGPGRGSSINFDQICARTLCNIKKSQYLVVLPKVNAIHQYSNLLSCKKQFSQSTGSPNSAVTGYFENGHWESLTCINQLRTFSNLRTCLNDKVVYFIGDSTIRQFFYLVAEKLRLSLAGPDNSVIWQQPKVAYAFSNSIERTYNTTLYYRAHGPPLQNPGPPNTRPYISDTITDIPVGGPDVYLIFNIGAHLVNYHPSIFIHRLRGIKQAILKHHQKFPETKVLLRGLNVVEIPFEWNIYRFERILRSIFKNMNNVVYLNFWDIGIVWPLSDYHPTSTTLDQQALHMFSYVCS